MGPIKMTEINVSKYKSPEWSNIEMKICGANPTGMLDKYEDKKSKILTWNPSGPF